MVNRVLMVAFHYPPQRGSSGIQRTLSFSRQLPQFGWEPIVLTASRSAYPDISEGQANDPEHVHRSLALDASRHLSVRGRYPGWFAQPDRWISWWLSAVPRGLALIRRYRPCVIWSTYPIATAHMIALSLHRLTGLPWIADQRDPLTDTDYPPDPRTRAIHLWLERRAMLRAAALVCTTPGAIRDWQQRYPELSPGHLALIENGYDEQAFAASRPLHTRSAGPFRLLHSGLVYPAERDPTELFAALSALRRDGNIGPDNFSLMLRAGGHDAYLAALIARHGIADLVELGPPQGYQDALAEMLSADALLLLQGASCNAQIPAKLYEYLRAGRPILALTDPAGDTASALRLAGIDTIGRLDCREDAARALLKFLQLCGAGHAPTASQAHVLEQERGARSRQLAALLDKFANPGRGAQL
jgi:glycosyltransferase involved in cell wall biosynthesis